MQCPMPPKNPCPVVRKSRAVVNPAPKAVQPAPSQSSAQGTATSATQTVVINVVPAKSESYATPAPQVVTRVVVKREVRTVSVPKRFHLFILAGMAPTQHVVSSTECSVAKQQCQVDVKRKYVLDGGLGGNVSLNNGVTLGIAGTVQGSVYGTLGFSF